MISNTASRIKEALEIRNMKQSDLVEKTGISKGALSSYVSGRYIPKQTNTYKIAMALNVDVSWLMGNDVPMEPKKTIDGGLNNYELTESILLIRNDKQLQKLLKDFLSLADVKKEMIINLLEMLKEREL